MEIRHLYGSNVHILSNVYLLSLLAELCSEKAHQPLVHELVTRIYSGLLEVVLNQEFPVKNAKIPTRMAASHPEGVYQGPILDPETRVVSVNLARAGTVPSQICYLGLNYLSDPTGAARKYIALHDRRSGHARLDAS